MSDDAPRAGGETPDLDPDVYRRLDSFATGSPESDEHREDVYALLEAFDALRASLLARHRDGERLDWRKAIRQFCADELHDPNCPCSPHFLCDTTLAADCGHGELLDLLAKRPESAALLARHRNVERDTKRLDWLETMVVNVRESAHYGSWNVFWASPESEDGSDAAPSDIRAKIDAAMSAPPSPERASK